MTSPEAYPFKTLDQAKAVREAQERVHTTWSPATYMQVIGAMPRVAIEAGHLERDWATSVETQRRDWETPQAAAERLALWVTLHAERWGRVPTERAIQRTTEPTPRPGFIVTQQEKAAAPWPRKDRHSW